MIIPATCLLAAAAVLAAAPAWALTADDVLSQHDRWSPGEGIEANSWYTYLVCDAREGCAMYRLDVSDVGFPWNVTVTVAPMDFLGGTESIDDVRAIMKINERFGIRWDGMPSMSYNTTLNPDSMAFKYAGAGQKRISSIIEKTVLFFGGTLRMPHGHDPILEVGRIWVPQGSSQTDSPIVITAMRAPHESCGSMLNGTAYNAAYGTASRVNTLIMDGFPFPASGTATAPSGEPGSIDGDSRLTHSHWYELVEHSGGLGNADLGNICEMAAGLRDPGAAEPNMTGAQPAVQDTDAEAPGLSVMVDMQIYRVGDSILVSGNITEPLPAYPPVSISITGHDGIAHAASIPPNHLNEYSSAIMVGQWDGGAYTLEAGYGDATSATTFTVLGGWSAGSFSDLQGIPVDAFGIDAQYGIVGGSVMNAFGYAEDRSIVLDMEAPSDGAVLLEVPPDVAAFIGGSGLGFAAYVNGVQAPAVTLYAVDGVGILVEFAAGTTDIKITGGT